MQQSFLSATAIHGNTKTLIVVPVLVALAARIATLTAPISKQN
jgi:hypothetical protein